MITNYCRMSQAIEERFDGGPLLMPADAGGSLISVHDACWMHRVWAQTLPEDNYDYAPDPGCECPCHRGRSALAQQQSLYKFSLTPR
jgi:hypothetical protein